MKKTVFILSALFVGLSAWAQNTSVRPGQVWLDTAGEPISCHGHAVIYNPDDSTYYWYGENKERTFKGSNVWSYGFRCYSSKDFYNWKDEGLFIFPETTNTKHPLHYSQYLDRPHILYNKATKRYVCWIKNMGDNDGYFVILQSKKFLGPYEIVNPGYRPNGFTVGDFEFWVDDETGKGFVWFEYGHWEMICAELSDDYLSVTDKYSEHFEGLRPPLTRESPAHFIKDGVHYMLTSGTTHYYPNESNVVRFKDPHEAYEDLGNPHPTDTSFTSFHSQICDVIKIPGKKNLYVAVADRWVPQAVGTDAAQKFRGTLEKAFANHKSPWPRNYEPVEIVDRSKARRTSFENTATSTYVWLPIVWEEGDVPRIYWLDEWRLEDYD